MRTGPFVVQRAHLQFELLERIVDALRLDPACQAAALVGSLADGRGDRVWDVDLIVFAGNRQAGALAGRISGLFDADSIFFRMDGRYDDASVFVRLILFDFMSIEFHVFEPTTEFVLLQPWTPLLDKADVLDSRAGEGRSPGHDATQAFARGDAELAWELFNCVKRAARGDLAGTKAYIVELAAAILRAGAATSSGR